MNRLIIVDDNPNLVDGLTRLVDWQSYGIELAGSASNGLEALALVERARPDIVITDISMPLMDGLVFIEQARRLVPHLQMIVLSGFERFDYAQQAIRLGVLEYLLKPIKLDLIVAAIVRAQERLQVERQEQEAVFSQALLQLATLPELAPELRLQLAGGLGLEPGQQHTMLAVESGGVVLAARTRLPHAFTSGIYGGVLVVGPPERIAQTISWIVESCGALRPTIGVGRTYQSPDRLAASYHEAQIALEHLLFHGDQDVLAYADLPRASTQAAQDEAATLYGRALSPQEPAAPYQTLPAQYPEMLERDLLINLQSGNVEAALALLEQFFCALPGDPAYLRAASQELLAMVLRVQPEATPASAAGQKAQSALSLRQLQACRTLPEIKGYLAELIRSCARQAAEQRRNSLRGTVELACDFISANLHSEISLDDVAAELHFSPSYLAHLFKKATGKTVVEHITLLKMERAAELLREPDARVAGVAAALGYQDRRYFSELFRRYKGCTPREYREQFLPAQEA